MVALGPKTAPPHGSGNLPRMESSLWMRVSHYGKRIRLVVRVRPIRPAPSCKKPRDTAPSSDSDALSARPSLDGRLSRADGQYSSENIPGSEISLWTGCRDLLLCSLGCHACKWRVQRRAGPTPASWYSSGTVSRLPSLLVSPQWRESRYSPMPLTLASRWQSSSWRLPRAVMVSPRACWFRAWCAEVPWFGGILRSHWHTYVPAGPLLASTNP